MIRGKRLRLNQASWFMLKKPTFASKWRLAVFAVMVLALTSSMLVPRGNMIAPSSTQLFNVSACPETNPVARMAAHAMDKEQRMAHAAMGHDIDPAHGDPKKG